MDISAYVCQMHLFTENSAMNELNRMSPAKFITAWLILGNGISFVYQIAILCIEFTCIEYYRNKPKEYDDLLLNAYIRSSLSLPLEDLLTRRSLCNYVETFSDGLR